MNTSTTPKVQYQYANGSANTIRPTKLIYPDGRELNSDYGSANSMADALSRVAGLVDDDGTTHLADYAYLGLGTFVEVDYTEPELKYTLVGTAGGNDPDTGDIYRGFDRFGRIKDSYWRNYGTNTDADRIKYGYDRNSSRTYRENTVATAAGAHFDEKYLYDLIDRLKSMDRGTLNELKDAITDKNFAQCWSLDATGNWRKFLEDANGDGSWDLDQSRTANRVNEVTDVSDTAGPAWVTPVFNRAGNMTTIPKPADPTQYFTGTYDAWHRLIRLASGGNTVQENEYDGAKRRTVKKSYTAGVLSETRHLFYTEPSKWQIVEERVGSSSNAERQSVWGLRYIDDLVLRDRDTNDDGSFDERLYALQDANWNVTAIVTSGGGIQERYSYTPYGMPIVLTAAFASRTATLYDWETTFAGYRFDPQLHLFVVRNRVLHVYFGWLQRDPVGYLDSSNLYQYCKSEPLAHVDSLGLAIFSGPLVAFVIALSCALGMLTLSINDAVSMVREYWLFGVVPPLRTIFWRQVCSLIGGCIAGLAALAGVVIAMEQLELGVVLGILFVLGILTMTCIFCSSLVGCLPAWCQPILALLNSTLGTFGMRPLGIGPNTLEEYLQEVLVHRGLTW